MNLTPDGDAGGCLIFGAVSPLLSSLSILCSLSPFSLFPLLFSRPRSSLHWPDLIYLAHFCSSQIPVGRSHSSPILQAQTAQIYHTFISFLSLLYAVFFILLRSSLSFLIKAYPSFTRRDSYRSTCLSQSVNVCVFMCLENHPFIHWIGNLSIVFAFFKLVFSDASVQWRLLPY